MILGSLQEGRAGPQESFRPGRGIHSGPIVASVKTCLELANPIKARGDCQLRIVCELPLEGGFVRGGVGPGHEARREAAQRDDQAELADKASDDEAEGVLAHYRQRGFHPRLDVGQGCSKPGWSAVTCTALKAANRRSPVVCAVSRARA